MAQPGSEVDPIGQNTAVPDPSSLEQLMVQMAAMMDQIAALKAEILQLRGIDEDDLEYIPPAAAVRQLFAEARATVPESFSMTPQRGRAAAANAAPTSEGLRHYPADGRDQRQACEQADWYGWGGPGVSRTQQGWIDYGVGVVPPPQSPPGFADPLANPLLDPWKRSAHIDEKHADEANWAAQGWIDRSKKTQHPGAKRPRLDPSVALQSFIQHSKSLAPLGDYSQGCSHTSPRRMKPKPPECPPPDHRMVRSLRLDVSQPVAASIGATAFAEVNTRGKVFDHDDVPPHTSNRKLGCYILVALGSIRISRPAAGDCLSESDVDN